MLSAIIWRLASATWAGRRRRTPWRTTPIPGGARTPPCCATNWPPARPGWWPGCPKTCNRCCSAGTSTASLTPPWPSGWAGARGRSASSTRGPCAGCGRWDRIERFLMPERDELLADALADALGQLHRHGRFDTASWLTQHPELADELPAL